MNILGTLVRRSRYQARRLRRRGTRRGAGFAGARRQARRPGERGAASFIAVASISVILLVVLASLTQVQVSSKLIGRQLRYQGQALNTAMAGSTEGIAWFQRQSVQPVATFSPQLNPSASPPVNETEDPNIGIVRTFRISDPGHVWGRYEVRTPTALDVTARRGKTGTGTMWQFDSAGLIFLDSDNDGLMTFTDSNSNGVFDWGEPGEVLAMRKVRSEVTRLALVLPGGNAAIQGHTCSVIRLNSGTTKVRVLGSSAGTGIACRTGTGSPVTWGATLLGNPKTQTNVNPFNDSIEAVFGVSQNELLNMATLNVPDVATLPATLPAMSLIVIRGNATFTTTKPLNGSGILVVLGNLVIPASSNSVWNGIIYVTGTYTQGAPSQVSGAVVGLSNINVVGASDFSEVDWDLSIVQQIRNTLGGYRFNRTQYVIQ